MKWIVSGSWKIDGKPGKLTVEAENLRGAMDAAKAQGLDGFEAIAAGESKHPALAIPVEPFEQTRAALRAVRVGCLLGWVASCVLIVAGGPNVILYALGTIAFFVWLVLLAIGGALKHAK